VAAADEYSRHVKCVAVCCSVLKCVAVRCRRRVSSSRAAGDYSRSVNSSLLQCVAACCSVLQCVAVGHADECLVVVAATHDYSKRNKAFSITCVV